MKRLTFSILTLCFLSLSVFAQNQSDEAVADPAIKRLSLVKKKQLSKLLKDVSFASEAYLNLTNDQEIVVSTAIIIKQIRKTTATLPAGVFRDFLVSGAGAWEKSLWFRYAEIGNSMMSLRKRDEIIKVYKLESVLAEDRATRLFEFSTSFLDMAADIAVASGIPTR